MLVAQESTLVTQESIPVAQESILVTPEFTLGAQGSDGLSERFGVVFGKKIVEKTMKFNDFPCFSSDFPRFSRITRVSDNQGFPRHRRAVRVNYSVRPGANRNRIFFL